jgi:hypothetical protein
MPAGQPGLSLSVRPQGLRPLRADGALLHPASPDFCLRQNIHSIPFRQMKGPPEPGRLAARNPVWRADRRREDFTTCALQTWQRPTLPRLETKYHQRWGVSRPCSEWERVQPPRHNHQVGKEHVVSRSCSCRAVRSPPRRARWAQGMRTIKPIELLVPVNFMRCRTSIPGLSTWSSSTALREYSFRGGFPA